MKRPGAQVFVDPIVRGVDVPDDYFVRILHPTSLASISEKLAANKFSTVEECCAEIELCWANAEEYYGSFDPISALAEEMRRQFEKLSSCLSQSVAKFCADLYKYQSKLGKLLLRGPNETENMDVNDDFKSTLRQLPTESEMENLIVACDMLDNPADHEELIGIVRKYQPELIHPNQKLIIVTTSLRPETLNAIRTFLKAALQKNGLDYPE
jgi:hypothetical protein